MIESLTNNYGFWLLIAGIIVFQIYILYKVIENASTSNSLFRSLYNKVKQLENRK